MSQRLGSKLDDNLLTASDNFLNSNLEMDLFLRKNQLETEMFS